MISLIELEKIGEDLIQEFSLKEGDQLFEIILDDKKIGYATIKNDEFNNIFIVILEKYQNNGYGGQAFKMLLSKIKEPIILSIPFDNVKMIRIIQKNNGREIGRNGEEIQYIIKK